VSVKIPGARVDSPYWNGVSVPHPSAPRKSLTASLYRYRWALWVSVLVIGVAIGSAIALSRSSGKPAVKAAPPDKGFTWAAGAKRAPNFKLVDQAGNPVSMGGFRGQPVLITFMDSQCRSLCPREARTLGSVVRSLPARQRPAIVAVSVNRWADGRGTLLRDLAKWNAPSTWHWAVGKPGALARVWRAYGIGVRDDPRTVNGITIHNISHTEATYVVDRHGYQRALFMYPFLPQDVTHALERLG
jgi:cytochrome oxidase Cu insertion factor (SCO1/SenC/PrrC family)